MVNKKNWLGMLVMVLALLMTGCDLDLQTGGGGTRLSLR
jgi:hypothetical protein